jgi:hypothetical protein
MVGDLPLALVQDGLVTSTMPITSACKRDPHTSPLSMPISFLSTNNQLITSNFLHFMIYHHRLRSVSAGKLMSYIKIIDSVFILHLPGVYPAFAMKIDTYKIMKSFKVQLISSIQNVFF